MQGVALLLRRKAVRHVVECVPVRDEHLHRQRTYRQALSPHLHQLCPLGRMGSLGRVPLAYLSPTRLSV